MQMIPIGDTSLNVRIEGTGPPLLLVHGFPLDHTMWEAQVAEFSRDHQVIAPDLRGFGASELGSEPYSIGRLADDLAAVLDALHVTQPVVLCALSMGGYVAWQFWDRYANRLEKLVLCDTRAAADSPDAAQGRRDTAARVLTDGVGELVAGMVPKLFADPTLERTPDLVQSVRHVMESTDPRSVAAALRAMAARPNMESRLPEIAVPTLLVCGELDVITPVAEMRRVASAMPNGLFVEIAGAGHMAPAEQAIEVNRAIRRFLEPASSEMG